MIRIEIRGDIARDDMGGMLYIDGQPGDVCSVASIRQILEAAPDDPEVFINIDSYGGQVDEGLAIYDVLRTSGKIIHTNIVGACHSMAVVLLLAAPLENRTANPNARALIHKVSAPGFGAMTSEDALAMAQYIAMSEDAILDIYEDRTGQPREVLERLMDAEAMHDAPELLALGFISKINNFNTNSSKMSKNNMKTRWAKFLANARNAVGIPSAFNYDYTDADGKVVFRTEGGPDEVLKVGTVVEIEGDEDSGTFILGDGREVKIEGNVVVEIKEAPEEERDSDREALENLVSEGAAVVQELSNRNAYLEAENRRLASENSSLRAQVRSTGAPRNRVARPSTVPENAARSVDDIKSQVRQNIAAMKTTKK